MIKCANETIIFLIFILLVTLLGTTIFWKLGKLEMIPTYLIANVAMCFSFYAYKFSKERFRLDLLDKRWEVYQETLKFCSMVMVDAGIPRHSDNEDQNNIVVDGLLSAEKAFRGIGYHKSKSLFGKDINDHFDKLNRSYAWFVSDRNVNYTNFSEQDFKNEKEHLDLIMDTVEKLPELFKSYVYFGNYKSEIV